MQGLLVRWALQLRCNLMQIMQTRTYKAHHLITVTNEFFILDLDASMPLDEVLRITRDKVKLMELARVIKLECYTPRKEKLECQ